MNKHNVVLNFYYVLGPQVCAWWVQGAVLSTHQHHSIYFPLKDVPWASPLTFSIRKLKLKWLSLQSWESGNLGLESKLFDPQIYIPNLYSTLPPCFQPLFAPSGSSFCLHPFSGSSPLHLTYLQLTQVWRTAWLSSSHSVLLVYGAISWPNKATVS